MALSKWKAAAVVLLLALAASGPALADHGHFHHGGHARFGVFIGDPFWPWFYPPPYYYSPYYYPPVVAVPAAPPVYIEKNGGAPAEPAYWYYCANPRGYYPYVKECPGGWRHVKPQPPPGQ